MPSPAGWLRTKLRTWLAVPEAPAAPDKAPISVSDLLADFPPEPDKYVRALTLPKPPKGVPGMAFDDAAGFGYGGQGGYLNTISGMGSFGLYFPGYPYLAQRAQQSEFRQPTTTTAQELVRKWIELKSSSKDSKADRIKELDESLVKFTVQAHVHKACLGPVYIRVKDQIDGGEPANPLLVVDGGGIEKGALLGFVNIEPMWCTPLMWNSVDPTDPGFYKPEHWNAIGRKIHHSRLCMFISREVPDIIKPAYNFGGISLTQLIEPYVDRWLKTVSAVNQLISNFSIIKLMTDMAAVLQGGPAGDLIKRVKLFIKTRNSQGVFLMDKTREELDQIAVPLSGLSELQAQAQEHMAAPTHLPLVVLTGITPAGLNASSDSEIQVFHDWIHSVQESMIRPQLTKMIHAIMLHLWGEIDEEISFDFVPLKEIVGEAAARIVKMKADAGAAYIDRGVIRPEEERARLADDPDSGYVGLDVSDVPDPADIPGTEPPADDADSPSSDGEDAMPYRFRATVAPGWDGR